MNYLKHHDALIIRARSRIIDGYTEKHHIIPRCMAGTDDITNIVNLTPEEHFVAHQLLVKLYPLVPELAMAVRYMCVGNYKNGGRKGNKLFGWMRRRHAAAMREINTGRKQSADTIEKRAISLRGRVNGTLASESVEKRTATRKLRGSATGIRRPRTADEKKKISDTLKERNSNKKIVKEEKIKTKRVMSREQRDHLSTLNRGKILGPMLTETKDKISKSNSGKKRSPESCQKIKESLQNLPLRKCPHCGKESASGVMVRWHFDNCKFIRRD